MSVEREHSEPRIGRENKDDTAASSLSRAIKFIANSGDAILASFVENVTDEQRQKEAAEFIHELSHGKVDDDEAHARLSELLYYSGRHREAAILGLNLPLYSTVSSYEVNSIQPWSRPPRNKPTVPNRSWTFLGKAIDFPIGVPASALTGTAEWIALFFRGGYNIITTKTFRSTMWDAYPPPNWIFLPDLDQPLKVEDHIADRQFTGDRSGWRGDIRNTNISTANSFGVPSPDPEIWQQVVRDAMKVADEKQLLIVSVMGDAYGEDRRLPQDQRRRILVDDFVRVAKLAEHAGAAVIELNLSCPNSLVDNEVPPPICLEALAGQQGLCTEIVQAVRAELAAETRLLVKLSYMDTQALQDLIHSIAEDIDGVSGINTVQAIIKNSDGSPAFDVRTRAGISGFAIQNFAIKFVKDLAEIRAREGLSYEIIGMGGVTDPPSFLDMYNAGASVVQSATGVFSDYALASKCIEALGDKLPYTPPIGSSAEAAALIIAIRNVLERARDRRISRSMLIAEADLPIAQANSVVDMMLADEEIIASVNKHGLREYQLADKR